MPEAPKNRGNGAGLGVEGGILDDKNIRALEFIEDVTMNAKEVQMQVLSEIITRNSNVEYLQRHGLNGRVDADTFKKIVPVVTYEDMLPDIERIANGDMSPILCSKPISEFLTSSGTSGGERKLMPTIEEELGRRSLLYSLLMPVMNQPFCVRIPTRACILNCFVGCVKTRKFFGLVQCLPPASSGPSASWKSTGLWPNTKYIDVIVTGTMSQYIPTLDYYSNGLPLVCTMYASSECYFGLNLNPLCKPSEVSYTLIPTMAYFEFLPVNRKNGFTNELVDLVDVKLGQEYELVVTTYAGLYRYRVGDILCVAGFKNKAPQFKFICRKNVALSIDSDKTDEFELQNAVKNAADHLLQFDASVTEYTSYADTSTIPGHYVLYWEIGLSGATPIPPSVFEDCCLIMEESLNSVYRQGRASDKSIGPLEIRIVEGGTFDKLMDYALSQGASINQYKTPRCVKYAPIIELLNSRVVSNYFSPKCPKWVAGHKQWCT
ncbi:unnamed protein product, partial [Vitis vinifera]